MAEKKPLYALPDPDDSPIHTEPEQGFPMSVSEAAESGNRLQELIAMRRVIARHVDSDLTLARDLAALTRRQMEISREIESLRMESEGDAIGDAADSPDESFDPKTI